MRLARGLACTLLLLGSAACNGDEAPATDGLASGPPPDGYVRYETPPIEVGPGESGIWKTSVADPLARDLDILDIRGAQSVGGHHALLYSSTAAEPIGTTSEWKEVDQLSSALLGGVGGEGVGSTVALPEGAVFRVAAGQSLLVQVHYLNATDETIEGRSYLDVKFGDPSPDRILAGSFTTVDTSFEVIPGRSEFDTTCVIGKDVQMLMWSNHMHEYGRTVRTTMTVEGEETELKSDPQWAYEWAFNPNFDEFTVDQPFVIPAGATINSKCEWINETTESIRFPDEMCVFFGFHIGAGDIACFNGQFID